MSNYTPEQRRNLAENSIGSFGDANSRSAAQSLVAIFDLLNERLPEKPMQVIPTPGASLGGVEDTDETLARAIPPMGGSGAILYVGKVNGGVQFVIHNNPAKISAADAKALAYAILRSV